LILGEAERDEIARAIRALERFYGPTPADSDDAEEAALILITEMMLSPLAAATANEASAEASGRSYMMALDDLPTWAVAAAVRRWYRGDGGKDQRGNLRDCHWRPAPADLRELAMIEFWRVKGPATTLCDLLRAEPRIEFSREHCSAMLTRLSNLMHETFGIPPVGLDDGSGGMVDASRSASADCGTSSTA
jgi:hypothetical protein